VRNGRRTAPGFLQNGRVIAITLLVASLAVADSVNPVTIAVAVYLSATPDAVRRLAGFAVGVFIVYLAGGAVLVLGPGELLRTAVHGVHSRGFHVVSIALGTLIIAVAGVIWARRGQFVGRDLSASVPRPGSALAIGAMVTAVDLPTAFPYFAAIAAIVGSDVGLVGQLALLVMFNALYVLPVCGILLLRLLTGERSAALLARASRLIERFAPFVLVALALAVGVGLVVRGASGLSR
jgi:cytochrome c biogenesis protein CcdA